jgi:hypothetical protein
MMIFRVKPKYFKKIFFSTVLIFCALQIQQGLSVDWTQASVIRNWHPIISDVVALHFMRIHFFTHENVFIYLIPFQEFTSNTWQVTEINGRGNSLRWPRYTFYPQRLALTSPTSSGRSVVIVRLRTTATEFSLVYTWQVYGFIITTRVDVRKEVHTITPFTRLRIHPIWPCTGHAHNLIFFTSKDWDDLAGTTA